MRQRRTYSSCAERSIFAHCGLPTTTSCQWSRSIASYRVTQVLRGFRTLRHQQGDDGLYEHSLSPLLLLPLIALPWIAAIMTSEPDLPPSPSTTSDGPAPPATSLASRDSSARSPNLSSPLSKLAVQCANLPNSTVNAACGATAGIASGIVTCPLDVIKTRLQAQGSFRPRNHARPTRAVYNGLVGTARVIWVEDGVRGMYRGLGPMLLGYIPTWAVYMSVYDTSKNFFNTHIGM